MKDPGFKNLKVDIGNVKEFGHCDTLDYFPLKNGIKPSGIGLRRLNYDDPRKNKVFQRDEFIGEFIENKCKCMIEDESKYFRRALGIDLSNVENFIARTLETEYPKHFSKFGESITFDELAMLVAEDLVVHCFNDDRDWAEAIHLCHANGWSAEQMFNWTFDQIHAKVPRMKEIGQGEKIKKMIKSIVSTDRIMERIAAVSFRTDSILNRHPKAKIEHKPFCLETNPNLFIRFERQTVKGFKKVGNEENSPSGFLFTIRTYFVDISKLRGEYLQRVKEAFENPDPKVFSYKFIKNNREQVLKWISGFEE